MEVIHTVFFEKYLQIYKIGEKGFILYISLISGVLYCISERLNEVYLKKKPKKKPQWQAIVKDIINCQQYLMELEYLE